MSVLLIRLVGPMQSWGVQSRFSNRDTGREPSKSGVIGLLCAALGRPRAEPIVDLAALTMGVRVDDEGRLKCEWQTAENCIKADGTMPPWDKRFTTSTRYYLSDAKFTIGLASTDVAMLKRLDAALRAPHWPLSLGRKSFVPSEPIALERTEDAIQDGELLDVLTRYRPAPARFVIEVPYGQGEPRQDQPVSFASRTFSVRHVRIVPRLEV